MFPLMTTCQYCGEWSPRKFIFEGWLPKCFFVLFIKHLLFVLDIKEIKLFSPLFFFILHKKSESFYTVTILPKSVKFKYINTLKKYPVQGAAICYSHFIIIVHLITSSNATSYIKCLKCRKILKNNDSRQR